MNSTANSSTLKPTGDVKRLSVSGARARILAEVAPVREVEKLAVRETLGRGLAGNIVSPIDVPAHTNSAVDGYALARDALPETGTKAYRVVGSALAGGPYTGTEAHGDCGRSMRGGR